MLSPPPKPHPDRRPLACASPNREPARCRRRSARRPPRKAPRAGRSSGRRGPCRSRVQWPSAVAICPGPHALQPAPRSSGPHQGLDRQGLAVGWLFNVAKLPVIVGPPRAFRDTSGSGPNRIGSSPGRVHPGPSSKTGPCPRRALCSTGRPPTSVTPGGAWPPLSRTPPPRRVGAQLAGRCLLARRNPFGSHPLGFLLKPTIEQSRADSRLCFKAVTREPFLPPREHDLLLLGCAPRRSRAGSRFHTIGRAHQLQRTERPPFHALPRASSQEI